MRLWHIVTPPPPVFLKKNSFKSNSDTAVARQTGGWVELGRGAELSGSVRWRICRKLSRKRRQRDFQRTSLQPDRHRVRGEGGEWVGVGGGPATPKKDPHARVKMPFFFFHPPWIRLCFTLPPASPSLFQLKLGEHVTLCPPHEEHLIALVINSHAHVSCSVSQSTA